MAVAYMQEFDRVPLDANGHEITGGINFPPLASQSITYTTSVQSSALQDNTTYVRIWGAAAFRVAFGSNPTAVAGDFYVPANTPVLIGVPLGGTRKIACYDGSS